MRLADKGGAAGAPDTYDQAGGPTVAGAPGGTGGAIGLGGGGQGGTGGDGAASGAVGALDGPGGSDAGGESSGGSGGSPPTPERCSPPEEGPGAACGNACGWNAGKHPAGYSWPIGGDGLCECTTHMVDAQPWIDVRGATRVCEPSNANDGNVRAAYTIDGSECVRIWAAWPGWTLRVFNPGDTVGLLLDECALVPGIDGSGTLPSVVVEVFGEGDGWIRSERVACDFGTVARACEGT